MLTKKQIENINEEILDIISTIDLIIEMIDFYKEQQENITIIGHIYKKEIDSFCSRKNEATDIREKFKKIELSQNISEQFKVFLLNEMNCRKILKKDYLYENIFDDEVIAKIKSYVIYRKPNYRKDEIQNYLSQLLTKYTEYLDDLIKLYSKYNIFSSINNFNGNLALIGANGSGKSTFARFLKESIPADNIIILAAQHTLNYEGRNNISLFGNEIDDVHDFQKKDKMPNNYGFEKLYSSDMEKLISALYSQYAQFTDMSFRNNSYCKNPYIIEIINLWNEIIKERKLNFKNYKLYASGKNIADYDFNNLSDGEKSIFYYISHVILAPQNSYIIIDEPENHLNLSFCIDLWDKLEKIRDDCQFVYLTHNLDFIVTRVNITILWNKSFKPPYDWDFVELPKNDILPEELVMEIVGSRKNIIFCEGGRDSLDYKIYSILFQNLNIVPVGGHNEVIESVKAFNNSNDFLTKSMGIIDGDYHLPEQIKKWKSLGIFTLPTNEIENILCDEYIICKAIKYFCSDEKSLEKYYSSFWKKMNEHKFSIATTYVKECINNSFKENFLSSKKIEGLEKELKNLADVTKLKRIYDDVIKRIDTYINDKNYECAIKIMNLKGIITRGICNSCIVNDYEKRIVGLIKNDAKIQQYIKNKYFKEFEDYIKKL